MIRLLGHKAQEGGQLASRLISPVLTLGPSCSAQGDGRPGGAEQSLGKSEVGWTAETALGARVLQPEKEKNELYLKY